MDIRTQVNNFNERWSISEDRNNQKEFALFKTRVLNEFKDDIDRKMTSDGILLFCNLVGKERKYGQSPYIWGQNICETLVAEKDEIKFYKLLQFICISGGDFLKDFLYKQLKHIIDISNVNLAIGLDNNDIILYPAGENYLDEEVVNKVLRFLDSNSNKHFIAALKEYQENDYVKSAESLRRTLEEYLRYALKNNKGFDKNIGEVQKYFKKTGVDSELRNIIFQIFNYLDKYFNNNSKHHDGLITEKDNEFLIYQTGLILRYLNKNLTGGA